MRALEAALNATWAMEEAALETLLEVAGREHEVTPEAIEAYRAQAAEGAERAYIRDGVGVITAKGPMFRYANLMTAFSGATSYDTMRKDLQALLDGGAKALILNVNSPGGEVNGANEFAQAVFELREKMPIVAYVGGTAASAGYWVASAASRIVVDPTALLGSLGAQVAFTERDPKPGEKRYRFVSSVSPMKNADVSTEDGANSMQGVVDALGKVFVETVARNRNVATETVLSDFGKGGILIGQDAVSAGLADSTGSFESVLAELAATVRERPINGVTMSDETFTAEQRAAFAADAVKADRERVTALRAAAPGFLTPDAELTAAIDGGTSVQAFVMDQSAKAAARREAAAKAAEDERAKGIQALKADEEEAAEAGGAPTSEVDTAANELEAMVSGVASFLPADRRGK